MGLSSWLIPRDYRLWLGVGALLSLGLAVLRRQTKWVNNEYFNLWLLGVGLLVAALIIAFRVAGRRRSLGGAVAEPATGTGAEPATVAESAAATGAGAKPLAGAGAVQSALACGFTVILALSALPDVFLEVYGVVPMSETLLSTGALTNLAGYLGGALLAVVIAWAGFRGANGAAPRVRTAASVTITVLWAFGAVVTVFRILSGRSLLPKWPWLFDSVVWTVNHFTLITMLMLAVALSPVISAVARNSRPASAPEPAAQSPVAPKPVVPNPDAPNPAERRRQRAAQLSRRRFLATAAGGAVLAVAADVFREQLTTTAPALSPSEPLEQDATTVWTGLAQVDDGHLHRFAYSAADDTEVRFIVVRKRANSFGVGLDACLVCGPTGYYERDGKVICKLCDVAMNIETIGFKGGCNPIPLAFALTDSKLVVQKADLEAAVEVFA